MKALLTTILGLGVALVLWAGDESPTPPGKRTMSEGLFFSNVTLSNDTIVATMPLTQIRFLSFLNGTNTGFVNPSQLFVLRSGDRLELVEKHTSVTAESTVTVTKAELRVTKVFDARSFGDSVKTNTGTFKLK